MESIPDLPSTAVSAASTTRRDHWRAAVGIVVGVALSGLVAVLVVVGLAIWSLSGGWDGLRPEAQPDDPAVVTARSSAAGPLREAETAVRDALVPVAGAVLGTGSVDGCHTGRNDWKVREGYTLRCEAALISVTALRDTTADTVTGLSQALIAAGYVPGESRDQLEMYRGGRGDGLFRGADGSTQVRILITPAHDPDGSTAVYYPRADAWRTATLGGVEAATTAADTATVTLIVSRTYFQD